MLIRSESEIEAEAATWLAMLDGPERSPEMEAALRRWLDADLAHAAAFERATEAWEIVPGAMMLDGAAAQDEAPQGRRPFMALAASIVLLLSIGGGWMWAGRTPVYETSVGMQQSVVLEDGTRVSLNTDSRISILYSDRERRVRLDRGEALFEVRKDPAHPFIVEAQGEQVQALGTTFVVRRDPQKIAVTLLEGKVEVTRSAPTGRARIVILAPGQRVTMVPEAGAALDRPALDAVTAWRRGAVVFTGTSLIDAAAELNRYGKVHVIVDEPSIASLPVSGIFATSDVEEFADAIAAVHGLKVMQEGDTLRLSR